MGQLLLHGRDSQQCFQHRIRVERYAIDPPLDQKLGKFRIVTGRLATDAGFAALGLEGCVIWGQGS